MTKKKNNKNNNGILYKQFKPKTVNQNEYIQSVYDNIITICHGPSGTGKSMGAIGLGIQYLINGEIEKLLVSRSIIGCGGEIGTLPGEMDTRVAPYMYYILEYLDYFIDKKIRERLIHEEKILLTPAELLRGHTYHNTLMILDEAQNCSIKQIKLFMSRIGRNSKIILTGDNKQSDINENGLKFCVEKLNICKGVKIVKLDKTDIIRHPILGQILDFFP